MPLFGSSSSSSSSSKRHRCVMLNKNWFQAMHFLSAFFNAARQNLSFSLWSSYVMWWCSPPARTTVKIFWTADDFKRCFSILIRFHRKSYNFCIYTLHIMLFLISSPFNCFGTNDFLSASAVVESRTRRLKIYWIYIKQHLEAQTKRYKKKFCHAVFLNFIPD